jgi:hypothetical protein
VRLLTPPVRSLAHRQHAASTPEKPRPPLHLVLKAYLQLVRFDLPVSQGNFARVYDRVRSCTRNEIAVGPGDVARICAAFNLASVFYWKQILCLQRSAATACLLKELGVPAEMVIGVQQFPFKAHAWVEVGGQVVTDKPDVRVLYRVLDRC